LDINRHDLRSSIRLRYCTAEKSNRTSTHDHDALARLDLSLLGDMDSYSKRLKKSTFLQRDVLRELIAEIFRRSVESSQGAINGRRGSKAHFRAEIVVPAQTCLASSTGCSWLEGNAIADFERRHSRADFDNCSCGFVPEHHGVFEDEGADPAFLPVVDIAAADAGVVYGYEDIVGRLECWNWLFGECYIMRFVEDEGEVLQSALLATA